MTVRICILPTTFVWLLSGSSLTSKMLFIALPFYSIMFFIVAQRYSFLKYCSSWQANHIGMKSVKSMNARRVMMSYLCAFQIYSFASMASPMTNRFLIAHSIGSFAYTTLMVKRFQFTCVNHIEFKLIRKWILKWLWIEKTIFMKLHS